MTKYYIYKNHDTFEYYFDTVDYELQTEKFENKEQHDKAEYDKLWCEGCGEYDYLVGTLELETEPTQQQMLDLENSLNN